MSFDRLSTVLSLCTLSLLVISQQAWAEGSKEAAFKHFSEGKSLYQSRDYQRAERSFDLSIKEIKDHQSLYYKALSVSKQTGRCEDELDAWESYLSFCEQPRSNCVSSWIPKAKGHRDRVKQRCRPQQALLPQAQTPPAVSACPHGQAYPGGPCLPPPTAQAVPTSPVPQTQVRTRTSPSFVSRVPWWGYLGGGLGLLSHIINLSTDRTNLLDTTYVGALSGYLIGGIGLGVGVYRYSASDEPSQGVSRAQYAPQHTAGTYLFTWSGRF